MADPFEAGVISYLPKLRRYARSLTHDKTASEDLVQDTMVRALRFRHQFVPGTQLRNWLFTIMHNKHASDVRRAIRQVDVDVDTVVIPIEANFDGPFLIQELKDSLRKLPAMHRKILVMAAAGMTYKSIANAESLPLGTVRSRLHRARDILKERQRLYA